MIGKEFGYLKVISEAPSIYVGKAKQERKKVNVACRCGKNFVISVRTLSPVSSCGCVKLSRRESKSLTGLIFGRLSVKGPSEEKAQNGSRYWICKCSCGKVTKVERSGLIKGTTSSCGCLRDQQLSERTFKHGLSKTPAYVSWSGMLKRCGNKSLKYYSDVTVCDEWNPEKGGSFEKFFEDMGERPKGKTLNRKNGAKLYSSETCEWVDLSVQGYDQSMNSSNTTGKTGVTRNGNKYMARISVEGNRMYLGTFDSLEEACSVRLEAEKTYYGFNRDDVNPKRENQL